MLSPYRVIDLTNDHRQLCGQMLGDLGADVLLVEPPGGSQTRHLGPFVDDLPHPDRSLLFWAYNRNKRSAVADLATQAGVARVRELIADADILIEGFAPGYLASIGLGYEALRELNPGLIVVSLTPFGQTGPKSGWAATDLTVMAASGTLIQTGDDDRAPCHVSIPQAYLHAGADGAVGALLALAARSNDGLGQHVDVSAQASSMMATQFFIASEAWGDAPVRRLAGGLKLGPLTLRFVHAAKDGFCSVTFLFGSAIGPFTQRLMNVMCDEGFIDAATRDKDWVSYAALLMSGKEPISELDRCSAAIAQFTASHTKAELVALADEHRLLVVPVATTADLFASDQLASRDYWEPVEHPEVDRTITYPGAFARFSAQPLKTRRRPPLLGEHLDAAADGARARPTPSSAPRNAPLAGVKVLDFMWVMAGPAGSRYLADYGATHVKVESALRVETARTLQPFKDGVPGPERSGIFHNCNAGKLGLALNLAVPEARQLALRLVKWADVVLESYSPRAMKAWGLDYESLRLANPDVIMLSSCLNGQTGPQAMLAGFGTMGAQLAGFGALVGWPDRPPAGPFGAYTDYVAPRFTAAAILAALDHRRRTGEGQYIDLSQSESSLHFIAPAFLDYTVNGRVATRAGNTSPHFSPHGVFPAEGDDRWVAIVAETEAQWKALCAATGNPAWASDVRFITNAERIAHRDAIEEAISAWTRTRSVGEIEALLQASGVPAHRVTTGADAFEDSQLEHRGHFVYVDHAELGTVPVENSRFIMSGTPAHIAGPGPTYGQHNDHVLRELLGMDDEEIFELIAAGALE